MALPSLGPVVESSIDLPPIKGPKLEPQEIASIESIQTTAGMVGGPLKETVSDMAKGLPSTAASVAMATTAVARPIAEGMKVIPAAAGVVRATAHEAIKMEEGDTPPHSVQVRPR